MATSESNNQEIIIIKNWINSVISASKKPSELTNQADIIDSSEVHIVQKGTDDAKEVNTATLRGILGDWSASSNTPPLVDGTGIAGDSYLVTVAGSQDFGSGEITFSVDDSVKYIGGIWRKISSGKPIYDAIYDTESEILALEEALHANKTYWALDTKAAYRSTFNAQLVIWHWQKLTVEYDETTDTFKLPTTYLGQTQDLGQELFFLGVNNSTTDVTELEPKLFLALGRDALFTNRLSCSLAKASDIKNGDVYGVSTTASLASTPMAVTTYGEIKDVKTDQWAINSVLYASSVAGELTDDRPENNARIVAEVLVSHATEGVLSINTVQNLSLEKESSAFTGRVVFLTGEPDGANYFASELAGSVATVTSIISVPNNSIASLPIYHTGDSPQQVDRTIVKGERTGTLSYEVDSISGQEKFYLEAYLVDELGVVVGAASGLPVGSLGVVPIGVLESPILNTITANQENTIDLRGQVPVDIILPIGYTVRYQIRCEKVGATGGNKTFTLYFGSDHDSKIIGLAILTTDTVQNTSSVPGGSTTEALNHLLNNSGGGGATNLDYISSALNGVVTSDTGDNATLPLATIVDAGLFSPLDKTKLDGIDGSGGTIPTLQEVTTAGNTTTDAIQSTNSLEAYTSTFIRTTIGQGYVDAYGGSSFKRVIMSALLGNIQVGNGSIYKTTLQFPNATVDRTINLQDKDGTLAFLSDIGGGSTPTLQEVTAAGNTTTDYIESSNSLVAQTSLYERTTIGPTYIQLFGGSTSNKILIDPVLGQIKIAYGSTNNTILQFPTATSNKTLSFQNGSGTLAFLSDIVAPDLSNYVTLNTVQAITGYKTFETGAKFIEDNILAFGTGSLTKLGVKYVSATDLNEFGLYADLVVVNSTDNSEKFRFGRTTGDFSSVGSNTANSFVKAGATADDVLLGDGSTTPLSGIGGGSGGTIVLYKNVDQSKSSTVSVSDDSELTFATEANAKYIFELGVRYKAASDVPDLKIAFTSKTEGFYAYNYGTTNEIVNTLSATRLISASTLSHFSEVRGSFAEGGTAGTFTFRWAQNTNDAGATTVEKGSYLKITKAS